MSARSFVIFPISSDLVREVLDELVNVNQRIASNLETKYLLLTDPAGDALALSRDCLGSDGSDNLREPLLIHFIRVVGEQGACPIQIVRMNNRAGHFVSTTKPQIAQRINDSSGWHASPLASADKQGV
jgi:hypothetical protein